MRDRSAPSLSYAGREIAGDVATTFVGVSAPNASTAHLTDILVTVGGENGGTGQISRLHVSEGDRSDVVLFENWTVYATGKPFHVHTVNSRRANAEGQLTGFINYPDVEAMAAAYAP